MLVYGSNTLSVLSSRGSAGHNVASGWSKTSSLAAEPFFPSLGRQVESTEELVVVLEHGDKSSQDVSACDDCGA